MLRLAILGLDPFQHDWLAAVAALRASGELQLVALGHHSAATARQLADFFTPPTLPTLPASAAPIPAYDDPRRLLQEISPQILLLDRPSNISLDFLLQCVDQGIGLFSLGPPVESLAEAQALAQHLEPRTHLLHIWPHFADSPAARRCAQADDFLRPIRFAAASWLGINHALASKLPKGPAPHSELRTQNLELLSPVRSLTVLAWDALATLIPLMGLPTAVYAAIRGTVGNRNNFADISGAAAVTLRFADDAAASLTLCDRIPLPTDPGSHANAQQRDLLLWGGKGDTLRITSSHYEFRDPAGTLIDSSPPHSPDPAPSIEYPSATALAALREFLRQFSLPPSPTRGTPHLLEDIAATLEALIVSHRTGQPESPDHLRRLRR